MMETCRNIYQFARKTADLTQEVAASLLPVASRTLGAYERGESVPPEDIVDRMCEAYKTPWLAYLHLQGASILGQKYLPEIEVTDISRSVLILEKELDDVAGVSQIMRSIACDNVIDDTEQGDWIRVQTEAKHLAGAAFSLFFTEKKTATRTA